MVFLRSSINKKNTNPLLLSIEWNMSISKLFENSNCNIQKDTTTATTTTTVTNHHNYYLLHELLMKHDCKYVLPDLNVTTTKKLLTDGFLQKVSKPDNRIVTVAVNQHTKTTWDTYIQSKRRQLGSNHLLIVGGNHKSYTSNFTTYQAIRQAATIHQRQENKYCDDNNMTIWAVTDPNIDSSSNRNHIDTILRKIESGATGIITQPLLTSYAIVNVQKYIDLNVIPKLVIGFALPKNNNNLLFWSKLLKVESNIIQNDILFQNHLQYLNNKNGCSSFEWIQTQHSIVNELIMNNSSNNIGIHYMPLNNTSDLLALLLP